MQGISRGGESTTSLDSTFQCSVTLTAKFSLCHYGISCVPFSAPCSTLCSAAKSAHPHGLLCVVLLRCPLTPRPMSAVLSPLWKPPHCCTPPKTCPADRPQTPNQPTPLSHLHSHLHSHLPSHVLAAQSMTSSIPMSHPLGDILGDIQKAPQLISILYWTLQPHGTAVG